MSPSADLPAVRLVDNGDGSYTVVSDFLEQSFGINGPTPSQVDDPVGQGPMGVSPQEFVSIQNGKLTATVPDTGAGFDAGKSTAVQSAHAVGFSAALTKNVDLYDPTYKKVDWACVLYYDSNGSLMLDASNQVETSRTNIDSIAGTGHYSRSDVDIVTSIQSRNILNYAVGDFDGDGSDEIAIHHQYWILVLGYETGSIKLEFTWDVPRYVGYENTLFTPVSMAAGDIDRDGADEIVVARGYYQGGQAGRSEFTDLGVMDPDGSRWVRVSMTDPKNSQSVLDSVMTSVTCADVDNDGRQEVVVGGYLWDNTQTSTGYNEDWDRSAGELYLSYVEPEDLLSGRGVFRALTVFGDDNGTATTRFIKSNGSFDDHYKLHDHDRADTSIYLTDNSDNPSGLCRSVNWCNWVLPLESVSLSGYTNGHTCDQVFFDQWFYAFDGLGSFTVYQKTPQLTKVMDNNNISWNEVKAGVIFNNRNAHDGFDGRQELYISYAADLHNKFDGGDTEWVALTYEYDGSGTASVLYSVDFRSPFRTLTGFGVIDHPLYFIGNYNGDTYYAEVFARMFTYTDPTVIAVLAPVPHDSDLADVLIDGAGSIGSTEFSRSSGHESGSESTCNFEIGPCCELDFLVKADAGFQYTHDESWSDSKSVTFTTTYESPHGAVAMYVMPTDIYVYKFYTPASDGQYQVEYQYCQFYQDPVETVMEIEEYQQFVTDYNHLMGACFDDYVDIPVIGLSDCTEGDVASYTYRPSAPLQSAQVFYNGSGNGSSLTQEVELSKAHGYTYENGGYVDAAVQVDALVVSFGISAGLGGSLANTSTDSSGMTFSSTLSQGMEGDYLGEASEARAVLGQYTMTGTVWAEQRSMTYSNGHVQDYIYVGYTVDRYTSAPKLATMVADVYVPGGGDEDDPYNPTDDTVYVQITMPGTTYRTDRNADMYVLQFRWQGLWYDLDGTRLGLQASIGDAESGWTAFGGVMEPSVEERTVWVRVDGLSGITNLDIDLRIDAVRGTASPSHNPSLPVTCYKDTRVLSENAMVTVGSIAGPSDHVTFEADGRNVVIVGNSSLFEKGGHRLVFVDTELEAGERAHLWYRDGDGYTLLARNLPVYHDGYMLYEIENPNEPAEEGNVPMMIAAALLLVFGVAILAVFNRRH